MEQVIERSMDIEKASADEVIEHCADMARSMDRQRELYYSSLAGLMEVQIRLLVNERDRLRRLLNAAREECQYLETR